MVPKAVFESMLSKEMARLVRPPSKNHLGTKLRKSGVVSIARETIEDSFSTEWGFPEEDSTVGIARTEEGVLKPTSMTLTADK